ncbi:MAG: hypothetical protein V1720_09400 [bacterium]
MVLDLLVTFTDDGYNAEIPSIKGCDSWAHGEDEVIEKSVELLQFYLKLDPKLKIEIDRARKHQNTTVYKLIFKKN